MHESGPKKYHGNFIDNFMGFSCPSINMGISGHFHGNNNFMAHKRVSFHGLATHGKPIICPWFSFMAIS